MNHDGVDQYDSITDAFCHDTKNLFEDYNHHEELGGLKKMGEALKRGMVLVMSLWDDHAAHMVKRHFLKAKFRPIRLIFDIC